MLSMADMDWGTEWHQELSACCRGEHQSPRMSQFQALRVSHSGMAEAETQACSQCTECLEKELSTCRVMAPGTEDLAPDPLVPHC